MNKKDLEQIIQAVVAEYGDGHGDHCDINNENGDIGCDCIIHDIGMEIAQTVYLETIVKIVDALPQDEQVDHFAPHITYADTKYNANAVMFGRNDALREIYNKLHVLKIIK